MDLDSGNNGKVEIKLLYQIPNGNDFRIEDRNLISNTVLDREKNEQYQLRIQILDYGNPPMESFKTISVMIEDENDNFPTCNNCSVILLPYNMEKYPIRKRIFCEDLDLGSNSILTYKLENDKYEDFLKLEENDLIVMKKLEENSLLLLNLIIFDNFRELVFFKINLKKFFA